MPKQKNQGGLPEQPNTDGPTSEDPANKAAATSGAGNTPPPANVNPLADPAPVVPATTNPTAGEPASTPPITTPASGIPAGPGETKGGHRKLWLIVSGIVLLIAVVLGLLFLPFSPLALTKSPPRGPVMMIGQNKFVYACSVFDADVVSKELKLNHDKDKGGAEEALSFDPSNTKDKTVDLLKLTGESAVNSNCKLKFDRVYETGEDGQPAASYINVSAFIQQFAGDKEATDKFNQSKGALGENAKALTSYKDNSYYVAPTKSKSGPTYIQPVIKHKNMLIYLTAPLKSEDQNGEKMAGQLDKVAKDVITKIDNKQGEKPKNFSGITKVGKNKFVDACASVNYQKFAKELGGNVEYDASSFNGTQSYAPTDEEGKTAKNTTSLCTFYFRTKADADAVASQKPEIPSEAPTGSEESVYQSHYPHYAIVQVATAENKEGAQKLVNDFKKKDESAKEGESKFQVVKIGDLAVKAESLHNETSPYDIQLYYIAKDSRAYLISVSYKRQSQPFKTTDQKVSDEQVKKLLDVLVGASSYAQKR